MPNLNMQIKHIRIFLAIYSHMANTFARIFFINLRISCQKMLAALSHDCSANLDGTLYKQGSH